MTADQPVDVPRPAAPRTPPRRYRRPSKAAHLTAEERAARGKAARADAPLDSHSVFEPTAMRADPVELLERQAVTRVPDLVPIRYGRMLTSPFAFYRGAALIQAADLATTTRSGLVAQLCGDAHLSNFGIYASPERKLVFDINDFDETLPGPFEWDVKRLAASFEVAARENGFKRKQRREVVLAAAQAYRTSMGQLATMTNLAVWYLHIDAEEILKNAGEALDPSQLKRSKNALEKARTRDSVQAYEKLTEVVDGRPRIVDQPPLIVPVESLIGDVPPEAFYRELRGLLRSYRRTLQSDRAYLLEQFEFVHMARKVVGVGSVGTRAWIILMLGRDGGDPLFLQAKEAQPSVLEEYVGASVYSNAGQRVVAGQHLMQATSDIFLGWQAVKGVDGVHRDFYIRQLRDGKGSAVIEKMNADTLTAYARLCGSTLARAHARSGDRIAIASYLGRRDTFDRAIAEFAATYADQNERDYAALAAAETDGRVAVTRGL